MNLITFLKSNKNTRKIFGKREIEIIEKQLNGIKLTQSEKNRLSRDIREKFEFIKEASKFKEEFDLKKSQTIKQIINETKEIILKNINKNKIKTIWLYGSFVENELNFKSDIDIAIEFFNIDKKEATILRKKLMGKANSKIDIQIYNTLLNKIKEEIKTKGRIIWKE